MSDFTLGEQVKITSDDSFNGDTGPIEWIDVEDNTIWVKVKTPMGHVYSVPCTPEELSRVETGQGGEQGDGTATYPV